MKSFCTYKKVENESNESNEMIEYQFDCGMVVELPCKVVSHDYFGDHCPYCKKPLLKMAVV